MAQRMTLDSAIAVEGFEGYVASLAWSRDGRYLFIGTTEGGLFPYDMQASELGPVAGGGTRVQALAASPDGETLAAGLATDGSVRILSAPTGTLVRTIFPAHRAWVQAVAFSPDGKLLASGGDDGALVVWDPATGEEIVRLLEEGGPIHGLSFTPDGNSLVAVVMVENTLHVWDTSTWELRLTAECDEGEDLAMSPDGSLFATAGGMIHEGNVWETDTGRLVSTLRGLPSWVWAVAYAPNGSEVATGGVGEVIVLWDPETGEPIRELYGHLDFVQALAYSPDGIFLASGGVEVLIWDLAGP
jgi:glucose/arabinose dehydrogenase